MTNKELIKQLKTLSQVKPEADWQSSQRQVLLQQVFNGQPEQALAWTAKFNLVMNRVFQPAVIAVVIFVFLASGSLAGWYSGQAQPGDSLYVAKKLREKTEMTVTFSATAKTKLNLKFASERAKELAALLADSNTDTEQKQAQVANLQDNFRKELNQAKERWQKINEPNGDDNNNLEENVEFYTAGSNKSNQGLDIALPNDQPTSDKSQASWQALDEVQAMMDAENYTGAAEKLAEIEKNIDNVANAEEEAVNQSAN